MLRLFKSAGTPANDRSWLLSTLSTIVGLPDEIKAYAERATYNATGGMSPKKRGSFYQAIISWASNVDKNKTVQQMKAELSAVVDGFMKDSPYS